MGTEVVNDSQKPLDLLLGTWYREVFYLRRVFGRGLVTVLVEFEAQKLHPIAEEVRLGDVNCQGVILHPSKQCLKMPTVFLVRVTINYDVVNVDQDIW